MDLLCGIGLMVIPRVRSLAVKLSNCSVGVSLRDALAADEAAHFDCCNAGVRYRACVEGCEGFPKQKVDP